MDFEGQKLSEIFYQYTILIFALISFLSGYILGSYRLMMMLYGAGVALAFVISVPDWPYFNQHPLTWLPASSRPATPDPVKSKRTEPNSASTTTLSAAKTKKKNRKG
ncbi:hypothetical protein CYMTET_20376 [Cymbomonas tetramitiformis]|uniref:Signal peptidase complex subunit 1 n=1 Tax=Cymbomonas tetramitiformis TaxID=36881 RepID=A0AAE0L4A3_9CHLO|nr:hypothetical protein CYMTET_20376 [Cymbomonas tetramitiformis]